MERKYLNEYHKQHTLACMKALEASRQRPLSVEDVLRQAQRNGRSTIQLISQEKDESMPKGTEK